MTAARQRRPAIRGEEDITVLLLRAADGDHRAEEAFVARTIDQVWRYCAHQMGQPHADDATQATYLRALRSLRSFRAESNATAWLIGVARNTCLDLRRTLVRRLRLDERVLAEPVPMSSELYSQHVPLELDILLVDLSPERREAFVLTQILGFPYEQAATIAGTPIGTIRSRVARARADLARAMRADVSVDAAEPKLA